MDLSPIFIKLMILIPACCIGPGLLVVSRRNWPPMEKLCGAIAFSFVAIYLINFGLFAAGIEGPPVIWWAISAACALAGLAQWRTLKIIILDSYARSSLIGLAVLLAWDFLHLAMIRHYGGGEWGGDWIEQFQRTQVFLGQLPANSHLIGLYALPARPPLMDVLAAFFARQTGMSFEAFSLIFLVLNAWAFLPCCLLLSIFAPQRRRLVAVLVVLFMLNPCIVENVTLTVTKQFTAGLVVLGVCFYLRKHLIAAAITLAAAILAHYSAVPYAIAVGLHCLYDVRRGRRAAWDAAAALLSAAALMATWFAWSFAHFGATQSFGSTVMTTGVAASPLVTVRRTLYNLFTSVVPHPLHGLARGTWDSIENLGQLNDFYFTMAQQTIVMMMGLGGGIVVLILLAKLLRHRRQWSDDAGFWIFLVTFSVILGTAVVADWTSVGVAQITLQPLALMGVTFLAANFVMLRPWMLWLVCGGAIIDYALGILLQFDRQSYVYPSVCQANKQYLLPDPALGRFGAGQYLAKLQAGFVFWGDHFAQATVILEIASAIIATGALIFLIRYRARILSSGVDAD